MFILYVYKNELVTYEHVFDFDVDNLFRGEMLLILSTPSKKTDWRKR